MSVLDIIILILFVLAIVWGFIRGAKKRIAKLVAFWAGLAIALTCYSMLANVVIANIPQGLSWAEDWGRDILMNAKDTSLLASPLSSLTDTGLKDAYAAAGVPNFFASFFVTKIYVSNGTAAVAIASSYIASIAYAISFGLIFLLSFGVVSLCVRLLLGMGDPNRKGIFDRLAGAMLSMLKCAAFVFVVMLILIGISYASPAMDEWLKGQVHFGKDTVSLSSVFYNWAWQLINAFIH